MTIGTKILSLYAIFISACSLGLAQSEQGAIKFEVLSEHPSVYNGLSVAVIGCLRETESGATHLIDCGGTGSENSSTHIDVVGAVTHNGAYEKFGKVCVTGVFKMYDDEFMGLGYLTSTIGLLEASNIMEETECEAK